MKKITLKTKLVIGGILIVVIPLLIVGLFSVNKASNAILQLGKAGAQQIATDLANMTELVLDQEIKFAKALSVEPLVIDASENTHLNGIDASIDKLEALDNFFTTTYKEMGSNYELFIITDVNGVAISDSMGGALRKKKKRTSIADREYFKVAKQGKVNISTPVKSRSTGNPVSVVAVPLKTKTGEFAGIFATVLKLDILSDKLTEIKLGETGYPYMADKTGMIIAHPNKDMILKLNLTKIEGMESIASQLLSGKTGVDEYVYKGVEKISGFAPVPMTGWAIGVTQNKKEFMAASHSIRNMIFIVGGIFLILTVLAVLLFTKSIMTQLGHDPSEIAKVANRIAQGDLTVAFDSKNKKLTGVYADMKNMTENLSKMFGEISNSVHTLTSSSTELALISEQITKNSEQSSEKSNSVAAASEEMSSNMNSVAAATEETEANLQMIVAASEQMTSTIQEISNNSARGTSITRNAVDQAQEVSKKVDILGEAAKDISKVTETIDDISEQTNLLALNATIEAARAGEAGKGFAVVAGEIKALAQQTAEATQEINEKIVSVQDTTSESVKAIDTIVNVINEINDIVNTVAAAIEEQSATTQEISNNVSQAAMGVKEVNENVNQASVVTSDVAKDINEVSNAVDEVNSGSQKVNSSASGLAELAETLKEMVGRFKV